MATSALGRVSIEHPDTVALADADVDQAAHDVVDAGVDAFIGVHPAVEQQELAGRVVGRLLGHDPAQRDAGVVVDLAEASQPRQRAEGFEGERAHRLVGSHHGVPGRAGQVEDHLRCHPGTVRDA